MHAQCFSGIFSLSIYRERLIQIDSRMPFVLACLNIEFFSYLILSHECHTLLTLPHFFSPNPVLSDSPPKCSTKPPRDGLTAMEANLCNSCICERNMSRCSNLWCGLPNCFSTTKYGEAVHKCNVNEACVESLKETCLSPPCERRGDCRRSEPSLRTAPPKYPVPSSCWPNQAVLSENCSRISITLDMSKVSVGLSTEKYCHNLRTSVGGLMIEENFHSPSAIVIICDIKTGTNDTIEVTLVSILQYTSMNW